MNIGRCASVTRFPTGAGRAVWSRVCLADHNSALFLQAWNLRLIAKSEPMNGEHATGHIH
jgi:hypothetical protein